MCFYEIKRPTVNLPIPHEKLCKIPLAPGDLLRHLEQLWDEVQTLKREVEKLKRKSDGKQRDFDDRE